MAVQQTDVRLLLSEELKAIRSKIVDGSWYYSLKGVKTLFDLEEKFLGNLQQAPSRVHNALRNVGKFPLIITTNMDELLERFLWKTGNGGEKLRLDQISCLAQSWPDLGRDLIIKCLGDGGFNVRTLPSGKKYFEDFCSTLENSEVEFMRQVFNDRSVLFLGCDPDRKEYKNFFQKFAVNAKMKHYRFETYGESELEKNGNLLTLKANIQPWEFVQFLSTGTIQEEIQPGQVYERSYLRIQREEYLQQQLALEKTASEIIFHTINITNALSPDEYFEQISRPAIQDMFAKDPFGVYSEEKVQRTLNAMKGRRDNLIQLITESKTNIIALFFYHGVKKEIETWKQAERSPPPSEDDKRKILQNCKISIKKYAKAILLCKSFMRSNSSLEILIVGDQETYQVQEVEKETFALIRLKGGTDEAICYAETASSPEDRKFANHLININGEEVLNKRKVYERSRANAWSNEDSILKLATAIMKESAELKSRFGIDSIEQKDLEALETLTRISQKVRSQLDPGYLEPLGEGSFGQVFQAKKDGRPVAVKILKNIDNRKQIQDFEREVDMLREAKHPKSWK
ncbi:60S acidic ribosomal protein P1 [Desmophyllum pertusum]|uniref:60S acidic ribosomal protein P1 n=1 Tax=Desmophyllum pertusum TaxID=174260 RepID=A0A9W9Z361_9CNID|nr:60S acidic ribosomal protein P1 [Desmophyllum pertusum]